MNQACDTILEEVDSYIIHQTRKLLSWYLVSSYEAYDTMEADELIQRVRIKFWRSLEKGQVQYPYSYIKRIIHSEFVDMKRQQRNISPLPDNEEEERHVMQHQADPADEIIQQMETSALLQHLVQMVMELPPRQQAAMIYLLWDQVDDVVQLHAILAMYGLAGKVVEWPLEKAERQVLLASLSVARRKLAQKRVRRVS